MIQAYLKPVTTVMAAAVLIGMATAPIQAEENIVTLQEVVNIAKENNGELKALRAEKGVSEADRTRAGLYPNPVLELEGATGGLTGSDSENRASIGVSQEFLLGGKRAKRLAVAESELARFGSRFQDAERQLVLEVKTRFYDLLLAESRLDLVGKSQALNDQLLRITKERMAAGEIAELDVNLARVENARSEGLKIDAEREIVPARQRLLALMGAPGLTDVKIAGSPYAAPVIADLAELKALALNNRPDLQAAVAEKRKGDAELVLAKAERLPNLTAGIAFSHERSVTSIGNLEERTTDNLIGMKISIPIPVFDRNQAGVKEAYARKGSAEVRQAFVRQGIEREVEAAHAQLAAAEKSLSIYAKNIIPQLAENLKLIQEAYSLGEVGILSVIDEQKKFIELNDGYLAALYNRNLAAAKLEAAVGAELTKNDGGNK
ncbi:MAG: TolC family protein [Deltaproteobacteria bacterium]|nr:TolC family protein [Deltaproteobacteria bacterium]TLN03927.1 MAG: TolC family protein [bacterium]